MKFKNYIFWIFIILSVFILQSSVNIYGISLNLTVVIVYYAGIKNKGIGGLTIGAITGFFEDALSGSFIGINMLSKGIIGYISTFIYSKIFIWTPLLGIITVILFTLIDGFLIYILKSIFDRIPVDLSIAFIFILIQGLLNAIFGYFIKPVDLRLNI